ncbi:MAG: hypothetical protein JWL62_522 [Hyphomicrobiales bacterium]|nr:hypothetical protein [Hyphomicrobiales bacterium]
MVDDQKLQADDSYLSGSLIRNIRALEERRQREAAGAGRETRVANWVTRFAGSMRFVYVHLVVYGVWIAINVGLIPLLPRFDPYFVILAMEASVEAIFLSTFILISQNQMSAAQDKRDDLDLQISLLTEHELTKLSKMMLDIAEHLQVPVSDAPEIQEIARDVAPEAVLNEIEARKRSPKR